MTPVTIHKVIEVQAPVERVWRYVGTEAGLRQWWGGNLSLEAKLGGRCAERSLLNGKLFDLVGEVTIYDPPRQLTLLLRPKNETETWPSFTTITIRLKESEGCTLVTLDHQAFGALAVEPTMDWTIPTAPAIPERSTILNRRPTLQRHPTGQRTGAATPPQPSFQLQKMTWQRIGEARWDSDLEQLGRITDER